MTVLIVMINIFGSERFHLRVEFPTLEACETARDHFVLNTRPDGPVFVWQGNCIVVTPK